MVFCQFQPGVAYKSVFYKKSVECLFIITFPAECLKMMLNKKRVCEVVCQFFQNTYSLEYFSAALSLSSSFPRR